MIVDHTVLQTAVLLFEVSFDKKKVKRKVNNFSPNHRSGLVCLSVYLTKQYGRETFLIGFSSTTTFKQSGKIVFF